MRWKVRMRGPFAGYRPLQRHLECALGKLGKLGRKPLGFDVCLSSAEDGPDRERRVEAALADYHRTGARTWSPGDPKRRAG